MVKWLAGYRRFNRILQIVIAVGFMIGGAAHAIFAAWTLIMPAVPCAYFTGRLNWPQKVLWLLFGIAIIGLGRVLLSWPQYDKLRGKYD